MADEFRTREEVIKQLAKLREKFQANQISLLPKPQLKREEMDKLPKSKCNICGNYHATSKVIHLDYVGHAALTDRLLDVDPFWSWEPLATDDKGLPLLDGIGGMWIKLTVCGVTRLGYGDAEGKTGGNAVKERIGDALRNAAMRFGAALDLWHKGDLHLDSDEWTEEELADARAKLADMMEILLEGGFSMEEAEFRIKQRRAQLGDVETPFEKWVDRYASLSMRVTKEIQERNAKPAPLPECAETFGAHDA